LTGAEPPVAPPGPGPGSIAEAPEVGPPLVPSATGTSAFSLEGRRAPGLYLAGWLATLLGGGVLLVAIAGRPGGAAGLLLTIAGATLLGLGLFAGAGVQAIERAAAHRLPYVGPSPFLVFGAYVALSIVATIAILGPLVMLGANADGPAATLLSVVLTNLLAVGLVHLLVVGTGALSWAEMGLGRAALSGRRLVADLLGGASLAVPVILVTGLLATILVRVLGAEPPGPLPPATDALGLAVNLLTAGLIAPVGEEIFYRGFATTAWVRGLGPRGGLVRGAVFFAFVHVLTIGGADFSSAGAQALVAFLGRLPIALALGWIYLRRGSLAAPIGLHATFNIALVLIGSLAQQ
jgi:uncharacterized protein